MYSGETPKQVLLQTVKTQMKWVYTVCKGKKDIQTKKYIFFLLTCNLTPLDIPDKKRNAPLRTAQLSGRPQVIGQFSLYQCKGMSGTAASHVFCNLASKLC